MILIIGHENVYKKITLFKIENDNTLQNEAFHMIDSTNHNSLDFNLCNFVQNWFTIYNIYKSLFEINPA